MFAKVTIDSDAVSFLRRAYSYLLKFRDFLAWEAAVAMAVIEMDSSIEKPQATGENEAGSSTEKQQAGGKKDKGDRKSKKKTLGKGTSAVLMLLRDHATDGKAVPCVNSALVADWGIELSLFFDPKCPKLELLVKKVKEIVESNEVGRLPKIPKVIEVLSAYFDVSFILSFWFLLQLLLFISFQKQPNSQSIVCLASV
jgi:histidyl-tRNA synthetase